MGLLPNIAWKYLVWGIPVLFFLVLRFGFEFFGVYGQDSYEYLRYAKEIHSGIYEGGTIGSFFWPVNYSLLGGLIPFGSTVLWLQLLSFGSYLGILTLLIKLLRLKQLPDQVIYIFLFVGAVLSPYFLRASTLVMSDLLAALFLLSCYYGLVLFKRTQKVKWVALFSVSGALALSTRYAVAPILLPLGIDLILSIVKQRTLWLPFLAALFLGVVGLIPHFILKAGEIGAVLEHGYFDNWSWMNWFKRSLVSNDGSLEFLVPNGLYLFSPIAHAGYLLVGGVLLGFSLLKRQWFFEKGVLLWSILLYLFFIGGFPTQNQRYFVVVFPLVLVWAAPAFYALTKDLKPNLQKLMIVGLAVLQIGAFAYSFRKFISYSNMEKGVAATIKTNHESATVYSFGLKPALEFYEVKNNIVDIYYEEQQDFSVGDLMIVNPDNLDGQWGGKLPALNWGRFKNACKYEQVGSFGYGIKIFEVVGMRD